MSVTRRAIPILLLIGFVAVSIHVHADSADLDDLEAIVESGAISVSVSLTGVFEQTATIERLQSGLPLVIVYQFDMIRKRKNWFDSILSSAEVELVANYNSLTREYLLNYRRNRKLVSSESVRSIDELRRRMSSIHEESLFPLDSQRPRHLRVRARAVLGRQYFMHAIPRAVATDWTVARVQARETR